MNSLHSSLQTGQVEGKASGSTARRSSRTSGFAYNTCNPEFTKHKFWSFGWSVTLFDNNNGDILLKLLGKERGVWSERRASWEWESCMELIGGWRICCGCWYCIEQINRKEEPPVTLKERETGRVVRERRLQTEKLTPILQQQSVKIISLKPNIWNVYKKTTKNNK